jgi:hypothetical protein
MATKDERAEPGAEIENPIRLDQPAQDVEEHGELE